MLTKKVLINTLGAKIAPYGFGYDGFEGNVWRFLRTINGEKQYINVKKKNDYSFNVHLPSRLRKCDLGDLVCHSCKNDEELTALLNLLGDHIIRRALPELEKPAPEEVRLDYTVTQEMYDRLDREKDRLVVQFMERHGLDRECGTDAVMGCLLREVGQMRGKPFRELEGEILELAAVYGEVLIRTVGGEWVREKDWMGADGEKTVVGNLTYEYHSSNPLDFICIGWRDGEMRVLRNYMSNLSDYRKWAAEQREEYGECWEPAGKKLEPGESLLDGKAVEETIGVRMATAGFVYRGKTSAGWTLEKEDGAEREIIRVRDDAAGRKAFSAMCLIPEEGYRGREMWYHGEYRYRKFCFYRDAGDMRTQLEEVGEEMLEAYRRGRRMEAAWNPPCSRYHLTDDDRERFLTERKKMAEKWRRENCLGETAGEEETLRRLAERLDVLKRFPYAECREELFGMAGVFGDLLVREIGGRWQEYEGWRMQQLSPGLVDQPGIGIAGIRRENLPQAMVRYWEWEGGRTLLRAYRESKWQHGKWVEICRLAGLEA